MEIMDFANELKEGLEKATGKGFSLNVSEGVNQENIHLVEEEKRLPPQSGSITYGRNMKGVFLQKSLLKELWKG